MERRASNSPLSACGRSTARGSAIEWRNLFGKRAPKALPKSLLIRALAYRLQALELGDLDPQTLRVLDAYAAKSRGRLNGRVRLDQLRAKSAGVLWPDRQARLNFGPGVVRRASSRHGPRNRFRLERRDLSKPVGGRARDHRHTVERASVLRSGSRERGRPACCWLGEEGSGKRRPRSRAAAEPHRRFGPSHPIEGRAVEAPL